MEGMRRENVKILENKKIEEMRRKKLLEENKLRQESLLRREQEKRYKLKRKRMLEDRWEMARWISSYISENEERWDRERKERENEMKRWQQEWSKIKDFPAIIAVFWIYPCTKSC